MMGKEFDVSIIGGGVVGCAVLFELTRQGYKCLLLEKNNALLSEASSGNSGMLHSGFDAPANSLELKCIKTCNETIFSILKKFNIPLNKCGASLVAWTPDEKMSFPGLQLRCEKAGINDAVVLSPSELYIKERFLRSTAQGAFFVPGECVVDSNLLGISYAHHARMQGAQIVTDCEVQGFQDCILQTSKGSFSSSLTINCAGLFGDRVDNFAGIQTFSIKPRKGHYCVLSKRAQNTVNSIIFPIPTEKSKGVALFKTVYGNVVIGPTAEDVQERERPVFSLAAHKKLSKTASQLMPVLDCYQCVGHYAGVRPATQYKDYQITSYPSRHWITVGGIRSTGVSASLGIAQLVKEKIQNDMDVEPSRGATNYVGQQLWHFGKHGTSVDIDGYVYTTTHPICHFGNGNEGSKL